MRKFAIIAGIVFSTLMFLGGNATAQEQNNDNKNDKKIVTIKRGDTLEKIAKANETTYPRLFDANKKIKDPDLIYAGNKVRIPKPDEKLADRKMVAKKQIQPTKRYSPAPARQSSPSAPRASAAAAAGGVWDKLAACESGGNWAINTGNGYSGGLQFKQSTWNSVGGSGSPSNASKAEQIKRGKILQQRSGWGQWPACSSKLGL